MNIYSVLLLIYECVLLWISIKEVLYEPRLTAMKKRNIIVFGNADDNMYPIRRS